MSLDPMKNPAEYIGEVLTELFFGQPADLDEAISKYFTDDYQQETNGQLIDRATFAQHVAAVRAEVVDGSVEVYEALAGGGKLADRHIVRATKNDGSTMVAELYLWADVSGDGRIKSLREVTRLIAGRPEDEELASKH